jgi:hypothetical protein
MVRSAAPISGLPEIGIINAQVGYSRPAWARLEPWAKSASGATRKSGLPDLRIE